MEQTKDFLKHHGIKPSTKRVSIYEYLHQNRIHPSADTIYKSLSPEIPSLSKTTVYNTLKLFVKQGIVRAINIKENEARYDADISGHGHFKCKNCGGLFDIRLKNKEIQFEEADDFMVDEIQINLSGYCNICKLNVD